MCYLSKLDGLEFKLLNTVYKKYYKSFWYIKEDLYFNAYIALLEYKKNNPDCKEEDLFKVVSTSMSVLSNKTFNNKETIISLSVETENGASLNEVIPDTVLSSDDLNYKCLLGLFNSYVSIYPDTTIKKIYLDYYSGSTLDYLRNKYKVGSGTLIKAIRTFRKDFEEYLIKIGYLDYRLCNNDEFITKDLSLNKRCYQRMNNQVVDLNSYKTDFNIYKILRRRKNLTDYAECIGISTELLNEIVNHINTTKNKKLSLYQIQKLRVNYFNDYTLEELASNTLSV